MAGELITTDGQIEFGGVLLGAGTPYRWVELAGWEDLPDVSTGDVDRPGMHGAWPGRSLVGERVITWQGRIKGVPLDQFPATIKAFRAATRIGDEQELVISALGETLLTYGRVTKRAIPQGLAYRVGSASFSVQWTCSDPRRYSVAERSASAYLAVGVDVGGGLTYPLTYPLDYGTGPASTSTLIAVNELDADSPPVLVVRGPIERPMIVNLLTGVQLEFGITLASSDTLVIDCRVGTVLLNGITDRLYTRTAASAPIEMFAVAGGESNPIALMAASWDEGNNLDAYWRDATL